MAAEESALPMDSRSPAALCATAVLGCAACFWAPRSISHGAAACGNAALRALRVATVRTRVQPGVLARQVVVNELDAAAYDDLLNERNDGLHTGAADAVLGAEAKAPMLFKARGTVAAASPAPARGMRSIKARQRRDCWFVCLSDGAAGRL